MGAYFIRGEGLPVNSEGFMGVDEVRSLVNIKTKDRGNKVISLPKRSRLWQPILKVFLIVLYLGFRSIKKVSLILAQGERWQHTLHMLVINKKLRRTGE